jgi:hypothetical protein
VANRSPDRISALIGDLQPVRTVAERQHSAAGELV